MLRVSYKEWIKNVYDPKWEGWKDCKIIEKSCKPSRAYPNDWIGHSICFLNNYLLEKQVKNIMAESFDINLYDLTDDHVYWYNYRGFNEPDFYGNDGKTYELKQGKDFKSLDLIPDKDWHNADVRLFYNRMKNSLYIIDKEDNTKHVFLMRFKNDRIDRNRVQVSLQ